MSILTAIKQEPVKCFKVENITPDPSTLVSGVIQPVLPRVLSEPPSQSSLESYQSHPNSPPLRSIRVIQPVLPRVLSESSNQSSLESYQSHPTSPP
ncbi:hypothetical protein RRG08_031952 [Elysia crispata]|uniref:Uncharacterized protein n=1 Tax=Elysia crispata TaxID=231223 RepID=A0AAE0Z3R3_9GAST|nr:hypothetical protein RRG08_031952 [Elysia crispata]